VGDVRMLMLADVGGGVVGHDLGEEGTAVRVVGSEDSDVGDGELGEGRGKELNLGRVGGYGPEEAGELRFGGGGN